MGARMHGWETRMLLKHYLEQGVLKTELSRRFGVSRGTMHYWLRTANWTGICRPVREEPQPVCMSCTGHGGHHCMNSVSNTTGPAP